MVDCSSHLFEEEEESLVGDGGRSLPVVGRSVPPDEAPGQTFHAVLNTSSYVQK